MSSSKDPIINCHVHLFNGYHVPPELAKGIVPSPFHKLFRLDTFLKYYVRFKRKRDEEVYLPSERTKRINKAKSRNRVTRKPLLRFLRWLFYGVLTVYVFLYLYDALIASKLLGDLPKVDTVKTWLSKHYLYFGNFHVLFKLLIAILVIIFVPQVKKQVYFLLKKTVSVIGKFPDKKYKALLDRYLLIASYASYEYETKKKKKQLAMRPPSFIFQKLRAQYPENTHFIVLPMDMEYMDAGEIHPKGEFHKQMDSLVKLAAEEDNGHQVLPFIFIDPRRIRAEADFLKWHVKDGKVVLDDDCKIKEYLDKGCCGFKIYPALGYFPFDEDLLPLWAYAAQEGLPIMTHCVHGTIFYRGKITEEMGAHPVFKRVTGERDANGDSIIAPLDLLEMKGIDYQNNFTHPMNYICLLDDEMLKEHLKGCRKEVQDLFMNGPNGAFRSLCSLKVCLAHFGGVAEWKRHMETDNSQYNQDLNLHPEKGLYHKDYYDDANERISWGRVEQHWYNADWYTLICSMMLRYDNVFADISYILHDEWIQPLLRRTISHPEPKLGQRVLFGTDFFVVRNHKSDKELYTDMLTGLTDQQFDLIARSNPKAYIGSTYYPRPT